MLGMANRLNARILLTSTSEVYGDAQISPQVEEYWGNVNPIGIRSCYDEGKRIAETLMIEYNRKHNVETRIVRIFNTYGPRLAKLDGRVVSNFIIQAINNEDITIYGDGSQTRSFCFVDDLVDGLIKLMNSNYHLPINLGNPHEITIKELANIIISLTNSKSKLIFSSFFVLNHFFCTQGINYFFNMFQRFNLYIKYHFKIVRITTCNFKINYITTISRYFCRYYRKTRNFIKQYNTNPTDEWNI